MTIEIDMRDGYNDAAAWYALARLVEQQGEEGERCRRAEYPNEAGEESCR